MAVMAARAVNADFAPFDVLETDPDAQTDPQHQKEQNAADRLNIELMGRIDQIGLFKSLNN